MPVICVKENIKTCFLRGAPLELNVLRKRTPIEKWLKEVKSNTAIEVKREVCRKGNFIQYELVQPVAGEPRWWIYAPFFDLPKEEKKTPAQNPFPDKLPTSVKLEIPYLSQRDNWENPSGSCNVTAISMALGFFGHPLVSPDGVQLEDQLYTLCERKELDRHSPTDLQTLVLSLGYEDDFRDDAKWMDVMRHLAGGNPCVVHGYFSRSGHLLTIVGYNEMGWLVHDPWGIWYYSSDNNHYYDTSASGKNLTYPYDEVREVCGSDGDLWIHYLRK